MISVEMLQLCKLLHTTFNKQGFYMTTDTGVLIFQDFQHHLGRSGRSLRTQNVFIKRNNLPYRDIYSFILRGNFLLCSYRRSWGTLKAFNCVLLYSQSPSSLETLVFSSIFYSAPSSNFLFTPFTISSFP